MSQESPKTFWAPPPPPVTHHPLAAGRISKAQIWWLRPQGQHPEPDLQGVFALAASLPWLPLLFPLAVFPLPVAPTAAHGIPVWRHLRQSLRHPALPEEALW